MKRALAVLLAVLTAFSVFAVAAYAEDAAGAVYSLTDATYAKGLPRINVKAPDGTPAEVLVFQPGDTVDLGVVTASATEASPKHFEVIYYPDAASIAATNVKNLDWKDVVTPKYNLDTKNWVLEEGQTVESLLAKSPNKYKTFYTAANLVKGDSATATILGLNGEEATGRDSAGIDRGVAPIDYKLDGAKFLGWALYKYTWKNSDKTNCSVEVYALWDRDAAPEQPTDPVDPDNPDDPSESGNPIENAKNKVMAFLDTVSGWVSLVPAAVNTAMSMIIGTGLRNFLYKIFGIEAE